MNTLLGEFIYQLIEMVILLIVSLAAILCGKKLRDRKNSRKASKTEPDQ